MKCVVSSGASFLVFVGMGRRVTRWLAVGLCKTDSDCSVYDAGATCSPPDATHEYTYCKCSTGWTGTYCETQRPCFNGTNCADVERGGGREAGVGSCCPGVPHLQDGCDAVLGCSLLSASHSLLNQLYVEFSVSSLYVAIVLWRRVRNAVAHSMPPPLSCSLHSKASCGGLGTQYGQTHAHGTDMVFLCIPAISMTSQWAIASPTPTASQAATPVPCAFVCVGRLPTSARGSRVSAQTDGKGPCARRSVCLARHVSLPRVLSRPHAWISADVA